MSVDWTKLAGVLSVVLSITVVGSVAIAVGRADATVIFFGIANFLFTLAGYLLGNGKLARKGEPSAPILAPRDGA